MNFLRSHKFIAYLVFPLFLLIVFLGFLLSRLIKRNKKIWVFGSHSEAFADNSKYLYIYLTENLRGITPIWISGDRNEVSRIRRSGGLAYSRWSILGIYFSLRGGIWFYTSYASNINFLFWHGAELVNLWHGIPFKKIEFDINTGPLSEIFHSPSILQRHMLYANLFIKPKWVISTSNHVAGYSFTSAFRVNYKNVLPLGNPRLDTLFWPRDEVLSLLDRWNSNAETELISDVVNYKKVILYLPTWRDHDPDFLSKKDWDLYKLDSELIEKNYVLIIKLHVNTPNALIEKIKSFSNIKLLPNKFDIYPFLQFSDVLVTDYSSIYFDYLLLGKPVLLFCFDLDEYTKKSRPAYFNYDQIVGTKIKTFNDLLNDIVNLEDRSSDLEKSHSFQDTLDVFFDDQSGDYSRKITNFFLDYLANEQ